jgi:predicted TIM-barrel fold metal-dependent hydrolase
MMTPGGGMPTIDVQVHAYERNSTGRPWAGHIAGPESVTGDEMVAAMDRVGVDGAILVSPFSLYRFDASYALAVYAAHPGRFGLVKPVDTANPGVADVVADWAATKGAVGIRIMLDQTPSSDPADPGINRALAAAAQHSLPVNLLIGGRLDQAKQLAMRNPNTVMVIDHLGLRQPFHPPPPAEPWAELPKVLALAEYDNVRIKISGACTLSHEPFPYRDIWDPVLKVIDAFSLDRCMWGTDWTRATELLTYKQGVEPFVTTNRLSDGDRVKLMGGTLERVYRWSPSQAS